MYQLTCPYCNVTITTPHLKDGVVLNCPACQKGFQAKLPEPAPEVVAQPVASVVAAEQIAETEQVVDGQASEEIASHVASSKHRPAQRRSNDFVRSITGLVMAMALLVAVGAVVLILLRQSPELRDVIVGNDADNKVAQDANPDAVTPAVTAGNALAPATQGANKLFPNTQGGVSGETPVTTATGSSPTQSWPTDGSTPVFPGDATPTPEPEPTPEPVSPPAGTTEGSLPNIQPPVATPPVVQVEPLNFDAARLETAPTKRETWNARKKGKLQSLPLAPNYPFQEGTRLSNNDYGKAQVLLRFLNDSRQHLISGEVQLELVNKNTRKVIDHCVFPIVDMPAREVTSLLVQLDSSHFVSGNDVQLNALVVPHYQVSEDQLIPFNMETRTSVGATDIALRMINVSGVDSSSREIVVSALNEAGQQVAGWHATHNQMLADGEEMELVLEVPSDPTLDMDSLTWNVRIANRVR